MGVAQNFGPPLPLDGFGTQPHRVARRPLAMRPCIRLADDVALLIALDWYAELLPVSPRLWGWRFDGGDWLLVRAGEA